MIMFVRLAPSVSVLCCDTQANHNLIPVWQKAYDNNDYDKLIEFFPYMQVKNKKTNEVIEL